jgi:K+-sensing histidine kinase KdpD
MSKKGYIICIDDEQSVLNQLSGQLAQKFGGSHEIEIAESAEEALDLVDELINRSGESVELVICDQIMPGMKGDHFLENLNQQFPEIRKILLTGQAGLESAIYAINHAGLDKYVEKPWEIEDLSLTIKTLLEQVQLKRKLAHYTRELEEKTKNLETLHRIGIELNSVQELENLTSMVLKASEGLTNIRNIIYFFASGIEKKDPLFMPEVPKSIVEALAKSYQDTLEATLKSGIPLSIDHIAPCEYFSDPLYKTFPSLRYSIWLPVSTTEKYFGSIVLFFKDPLPPSLTSTLSILANHFASKLFSLELTSEKIKGERLATIGQMISSIIHDFKNPMTTIKGLVGLMGDSDFTLDERKTYSDMVIEEVDRVVGMVNELLEFSRGGRGEFRKMDILFPDLFEKICVVYEKEFSDKGIALEKNNLYQGQIQCDSEKIKRAIFNIIDNARDAMTNGGKLMISAQPLGSDQGVEITISDTGSGMPAEVRERIFEPFVTHGKIHGTGLGMAITKKIIDDHRGFIKVESTMGVGTTFTIRLPLK